MRPVTLWDAELRRGDAGTWAGSVELLASCFLSIPSDVRELRVRADAGFGYGPVLDMLEARPAHYAVVARMTKSVKRALGGLPYERLNARWEIAEWDHRASDWSQTRRCIVARKWIEETEPQPTLFTLERYVYRAWFTNLSLTPAGCGISMTAAPAWSHVFANSGRTSRCARFLLVVLLPTPFI